MKDKFTKAVVPTDGGAAERLGQGADVVADRASQTGRSEPPPGRCMSFEETKAAIMEKYDETLRRLAQ